MRYARMSLDRARFLVRLADDHAVPIHEEVESPGYDPLRVLWSQGVDLAAAPAVGPPIALADARWLTPVGAPDKLIGIGLNYVDHAAEADAAVPTSPLVFTKTNNALTGHGSAVTWQREASSQVDYEVELVAVIGRETTRVAEKHALDHVAGYTIANDISARDAQFADGQWVRGKSFDGFCPLGPALVTADEVADPQALDIECDVDGVTLQSARTTDMIFSVAELVSYLSRFITLVPGDVILTGTPPGVGFARSPQVFLGDGSQVTCRISGLGELRHTTRTV